MTKVYKLSRPFLAFLYALLALMTLMGLSMLVQSTFRASAPVAVKIFFLCWFALLAWIWYACLGVPYAITIRDDGSLEFISPLRRTVIPPQAVVAIKATRFGLGFVDFKYRGGSLRLISRMPEFPEFITAVRALNPSVVIMGY